LGKVLIAPQDIVVALAEVAILPPTARGAARPSGVEGKEKAMIGAVRITKVDAVSENFAYQWAQKGCYNSFLRTGNSGCFLDGGVVAL
jgi:hypothetical protein